jgi:hypothetical protein
MEICCFIEKKNGSKKHPGLPATDSYRYTSQKGNLNPLTFVFVFICEICVICGKKMLVG